MPNFYSDNADLVATFRALDLADAVSMLEAHYADADSHALAPSDLAEAFDQYEAALDLVGDISGNFIAPRSAEIDAEGAKLIDGTVEYAKGSRESFERLADAGMAGVIVPRTYGGLNFPATIYIMMVEMVSRADASMQTLFGYQDVGEAIAHFGPEDVARQFLPDYCAGRTIGAMVLTEPGSGSDLGSTRLKAFQDTDGTWRLRGTKRFISNGNGEVLLVLARSEEGTDGMFGLSLFACNGENVEVTRLEEKMGLHGSPTCELVFHDAEAHLVGKRRSGLLHVLHILTHARFSVAAQGLGIAEAAYEAAYQYAHEREAFGDIIYKIPAVADLLVDMRTTIEACRAMTYAGTQWLDRRNRFEVEIDHVRAAGEDTTELKARFKVAAAYVDFLSPAVKYFVTEEANRVVYDALQIHGGMGYMQEMPLERMARDVRVTTIYEGTTQVLAGAALDGVRTDALTEELESLGSTLGDEFATETDQLARLRTLVHEGVALLEDDPTTEGERAGAARGIVDAYLALYGGFLLLGSAAGDSRRRRVAGRFIGRSLANATATVEEIRLRIRRDTEDPDSIL